MNKLQQILKKILTSHTKIIDETSQDAEIIQSYEKNESIKMLDYRLHTNLY